MLKLQYPYPATILTGTVDNGPEFISRAVDQWAYMNGVALQFIEPGNPVKNAFSERFNGKFRDESLNQSWFTNLGDARRVIEAWCENYSTVCPDSHLLVQDSTAQALLSKG